jgi:CheY-like chemotaxis protein
MDFEEIDFDPELLAYDVCSLIAPRMGGNPVEVLCHVGDAVPFMVKGDPTRFRQVLTNLMGNAAKFTESGEIELRLDVESEDTERIKLHAAVRDTGPGILDEKRETIFEPFRQADGSTTRKFGGTGLGLSICRQISNLMDGDVWVESTMGKGSTFHFTAWLGKTTATAFSRHTPASLTGKNVLIVDDNRTNLRLLRHVLEAAGMRVAEVMDPATVLPALEEAAQKEDAFDLVIMDIQMPRKSGYQVAEEIRNPNAAFADIPLIALSSALERDSRRCERAGFTGFLSKPIRRENLYQMVERVLGHAHEGGNPPVKKTRIMTQHSVREERKRSIRILLAEDNPVNQKLAEMMLTKAGYQIEIVNNGREAVERYFSGPDRYDLIFMDLQMPDMDGLQATRVIRDQGHHRMPIVAMTAHAMKGDREKCLEAGMSDYITKPIRRQQVFELIQKWVFNTPAS